MHRSGARSPYLFAQPTSERSLTGLYEYVGEDEDAPDVVYVRHMNEVRPEEFPAYSIAEGRALARFLRERVATRLNHDPSRVKLIYKNNEIHDDEQPLRHYGVKQNSEVVARITSNPREFRRDTHSDSENDTLASDRRRPQESLHAGRGDSSSVRRQLSHRREDRHRRPTNSYTDQEHAAQPRVDPRYNGSRPAQTNHPVPVQRLTPSRGNSPVRSQQTRSGHNTPTANSPRMSNSTLAQPATNVNTSARASPTANGSIDPSTPIGQVQVITHEFRTDWLKRAEDFLAHPGDRENQEKQHVMLTEMIHQKVFLKGDSIDTDSLSDREKDEVRAARKAIYAEAHDLLRKLDRYKS